MRNIISVLILSIVLVSCKTAPEKKKDSYVVSGNAPGVYNGVRAYLKIIDNQRREIVQDTAIIVDEKFTFDGKVDVPQLWYLTINSVNGSFPLIIENKDLTISVNPENLSNSSISGSTSNDALTTYNKHFQELTKKRNAMTRDHKDILKSPDNAEKTKITTQIHNITQELKAYPITFVSEHPDNYFSLSLLESMINSRNTELEVVEKQYNAFPSEIKESDYGQRVGGALEVKKLQMAKLNALNIGEIAPNFTSPNPDGNMIALNAIKGKATIIDFWASWCGPCRRENPNVVRTYQKYHEKGLEIISVSLDRPGQKDRWLKAIEDDNLTWHHVSSLNYFNDPVAQLYNISSIPSTYILDASGKIVAKNLRGDALEAKIAELLN